MLRFVIRKMLSKKWMILALLIGNILLISIASGNPMYTRAVFQRTITKNLETYLAQKNTYPGLITLKLKNQTDELSKILERRDAVAQMPQRFGVDALHTIAYYNTIKAVGNPEVERKDAKDIRLVVGSMSGLDEHIDILAGEMYASQPDENGIYEAIVSEKAMIQLNLIMGDVVVMERMLDSAGQPLRLRITGVFTNRSDEDVYWVQNPSYYSDVLFIAPEAFESCFLTGEELPVVKALRYAAEKWEV